MTATFPASQQAAARAAFGLFSPVQGLRIFDRGTPSGHEPRVVEVAPRTWFIQPGMVNIALFETDEGLLMVDAGCAGDGPSLLQAVRSISDKPLHTVVYTHGHSDHAFGLWAFLEAGERPRIVAHRNVPAHFERYMKTSGLNALVNGQGGPKPWEYAARGGLEGRRFAWGDELVGDDGQWRCNIWQGAFPVHNTLEDGHLGTAPVASYPANGYGLHDMAGNVWEWCADRFDPGWYSVSPTMDPTGPEAAESTTSAACVAIRVPVSGRASHEGARRSRLGQRTTQEET